MARGLGFTVLPRYAREAFERPEQIRVVESDVPVVDMLWLLHRAEWPLTARSQHVLAELRNALGQIGRPEHFGAGRRP